MKSVRSCRLWQKNMKKKKAGTVIYRGRGIKKAGRILRLFLTCDILRITTSVVLN